MKPTLVVMAAGMGSRYGGLKQIDPVGPAGERIIDYSLFDAIRSGFGKVVFIIRKAIEKEFREAIEPRLGDRVPLAYVYQDLQNLPSNFVSPEGRVKPWGTGHAVLCCRETVREPFGVINADDFYGHDAFVKLVAALKACARMTSTYALIGYRLSNTLSPHGSVSRGVCDVDGAGMLTGVTEHTQICMRESGIVSGSNDVPELLSPDTVVSMNMWGFAPGFFEELDTIFLQFLSKNGHDLKAEFFIPSAIDTMLTSHRAKVQVYPTASRWMGMTYPSDRETVRSGVATLVNSGAYPSPLR